MRFETRASANLPRGRCSLQSTCSQLRVVIVNLLQRVAHALPSVAAGVNYLHAHAQGEPSATRRGSFLPNTYVVIFFEFEVKIVGVNGRNRFCDVVCETPYPLLFRDYLGRSEKTCLSQAFRAGVLI